MLKISVAMCTYNGESYIDEQIQSILNQTVTGFEFIIRDDCSTDNTIDILKRYAQNDKRIKIMQNDINIGFKANFERIISDCKGEYIAFADQDDVWINTHLDILCSIIGNCDIACGNALLVDKRLNSLKITMKEICNINIIPKTNEIYHKIFYDNFVQGAAMLVRRDLCIKYLPIPEKVKYHDYWLALVATLNNGIVYTDDIILKYRQHGLNVTNNFKTSIIREIINSINGFTKRHLIEQISILNQLKKLFPEKIELDEVIAFYNRLYMKNTTVKDRKYFKNNYSKIFLTKTKYFIRWLNFFVILN